MKEKFLESVTKIHTMIFPKAKVENMCTSFKYVDNSKKQANNI